MTADVLTGEDQERAAQPRNLRVLFYLFFPGGGIGRYTHELLQRLHATPGLDVELACLPSYQWKDQAAYPLWPGLREIGHAWPLRRRTRFLIGQWSNPLRLCMRAKETRADIIHLSNINQLTYPRWGPVLRRTRARIVATVHTVRRDWGIVNTWHERRQLKRFYRGADALFVHSQAQASELREYAGVDGSRIHIVSHGPSDYGPARNNLASIRRRYGIPHDKQVALFFGMIRDDKNLDLLLRALVPHRARIHLVVAGKDGNRKQRSLAYYEKLAVELGLRSNVTFIGRFIPDEEVPDLFSACDWVALPYSGTFTSQSGVLNVATYYRRPVLISGSPTLVETLESQNVGVSVPADSVSALDEGIAVMWARVKHGYQYDFDAYDRLFDWHANAATTVKVYRQILASAPPSIQT